jgi:hypothetical protein
LYLKIEINLKYQLLQMYLKYRLLLRCHLYHLNLKRLRFEINQKYRLKQQMYHLCHLFLKYLM